jgi:hypothetical protein
VDLLCLRQVTCIGYARKRGHTTPSLEHPACLAVTQSIRFLTLAADFLTVEIMSAINKELYDALVAAKVPDEIATAAARSLAEELQQSQTGLSGVREELAEVKARLAVVEKLQWIVVAGVIGLLIKSFL